MSVHGWLQNLRSALAPSRGQRHLRRLGSLRAATRQLHLEALEDRRVPAFITPVHYSTGSPYNWDVKAGDFNGDDVLDLVTANSGDNVSVLLGNPDGTFQRAQASAAGVGPLSVAVGDFNADGKLDLVAGNHYTYGVSPYDISNSDVSILLGNGDGTFAPAMPLTFAYWSGDSLGIATGDLDADGNLDLVATSYNSYGGYADGERLSVLLGHGDGSFGPAATYLFPHDAELIGTPVLADFNGDGNVDVAVPDYNSVFLLLGTGDGTLQTPRDIVTEGYDVAGSVAVADFDADGNLDLAMTNSKSDSVSVVRGNGDGSFQTAQSFAAGDGFPNSAATGDVNGDGVSDLVVSATHGFPSYQAAVNVLLGNGDGSFALPITTAAPFGGSVVLADFNADGRPDATVVNMGLLVLINDGNWPLPTPPPPTVSVSDATVTEGNTGTLNATFTLSLLYASTLDVTVHYDTANITAAAGSDYVAVSGDVIIPAGQTSRTFTVAVKGDRAAEPTETFAVNLSAATNATIGDGQGVATILDNEPRISISDVTKREGKRNQTTQFIFTVTLSAAYDQPVTMSFRTVNGTAKTGDDAYVARSGAITFNPGETTKTLSIEVKGDSKKETDETFFLDLSANSSNSLFTKNRGVGTILNDD